MIGFFPVGRVVAGADGGDKDLYGFLHVGIVILAYYCYGFIGKIGGFVEEYHLNSLFGVERI